MSTQLIVLAVVAVFLLASVPAYPYSRAWGFGPSAAMAVLLVLVIIFYLLGGGHRGHLFVWP